MSSIAVLVTTYNGEKYIEEQLNSLCSQTEQNFKCYIHDDGSTDDTVHILEKYCNEQPSRFVLLDYPPTGSPMANFLSMLNYISEEYVMFCDQDDVWLPEKIEKTFFKIKELEIEHGTEFPLAVYADVKIVDEHLNTIDESFYTYENIIPQANTIDKLIQHNIAAGCTMMINKVLYERIKGVGKLDEIAMHDWLCLLIAAADGYLTYLPEAVSLYRQHGDNICGAEAKETKSKIIKDRIRWFINGTLIRRVNESIKRQRTRAKTLSKFLTGDNEKIEFVHQLADLDRKGKLKRIQFYNQYKLYNKRNKYLVLILC